MPGFSVSLDRGSWWGLGAQAPGFSPFSGKRMVVTDVESRSQMPGFSVSGLGGGKGSFRLQTWVFHI